MVHTQDLQFKYNKKQPLKFPDISLKEGDQGLLKGNSGSGKTTFIHLLSGILTPTSGNISINQISIQGLSKSQLDTFRAKNIGLIFQKNLFIRSINMFANVMLTQRLALGADDKKFAFELFDALGIDKLANKKPDNLSQGESQRFSIARALVNRPQIVIADEPTSSLDDENCSRFVETLQSICSQQHTTLIIATHDARIENHFKQIIRLN